MPSNLSNKPYRIGRSRTGLGLFATKPIKKGDFISYVLYHFDNGRNGAGIYYGKVTKIEGDGTVHAKNIKLKDDDRVAEMRIKDNSLIVIMTKDLMDKLMLARLSIL